MKGYLAAIDEIQEKLRPIQEEAFEVRDKLQQLSTNMPPSPEPSDGKE
jgi:hypothetical protein